MRPCTLLLALLIANHGAHGNFPEKAWSTAGDVSEKTLNGAKDAGEYVIDKSIDGGKDVIDKVTDRASLMWILGVTLATGASFLSCFGVNLQKLSHLQNEKLPPSQQVPYYRQFIWTAGLILLVSASIADFVALAFVGQSLIAPLGSITLIANTMVAPCFLKEVLTTKDIVGTVITAIGCSIAVAFANHGTTSYTFQQLVEFFVNPLYLVYFTVTVCYLYGAHYYLDQRGAQIEDGPRPSWQTSHLDGRGERLLPFLYASIGGLAGSFSVTFAKAFVELIKATIEDQNEFLTPGPYVVTIFLVVFSLVQIQYLNKGLQLFESLHIVPIYQTFWIVGNVLAGSVYYQEYVDFSVADMIMFPIGISITLGGVAILSTRSRGMSDLVAPEVQGGEGDVEERARMLSPDRSEDDMGNSDDSDDGDLNGESLGL